MSNFQVQTQKLLGINGLGRIGKLTLWHNLSRRNFDGIVVNAGRQVGSGLPDCITALTTDSTYGTLSKFLYGYSGKNCTISVPDPDAGVIAIDDIPVKILRQARNPKDINWKAEKVDLVVDCTGKFLDPALPPAYDKGSLRGHIEAGAKTAILSAPFKFKDPAAKMPSDSVMLIYGINHLEFNCSRHNLISATSCTTTALAHMLMPLLNHEATSKILTASMSTIHAATNTQNVLDSVPASGTSDLRKNRSVFNNIIISSTGASKALESVLPQIETIGFMADSVRIPTNSVSLIILNLTFHSPINSKGEPCINRELINTIYLKASQGAQKNLLFYTEQQQVSSDLLGFPAAVVIEGHETHTRTGFLTLSPDILQYCGLDTPSSLNLPVTHVKIFGWYDNELGSYVNCLSQLAHHVAKSLK